LIDLVHLDGPIPDLLDGAMEWLRRNLRTSVRVGLDGHNYDHPELPLAALRELVANALVHRDLGPHTQSKRVEIRLRNDRLVISNPGGLWGVSRQQLGLPGGKSAVNEFLYDICTLTPTPQGARIIEGEGGGISEAQHLLAQWPAALPIFVDKAVTFTAILMRPNSQQSLSPSVPTPTNDVPVQIMSALSERPLTRRDIATTCHLTASQVRYALNKLIKQGKVHMNGKLGVHDTTYTLA
jgi:ATP-dependent DNA helicase RecG